MVQPILKGLECAVPYLAVEDCVQALAVYEKAFGAKNITRAPGPDGKKTTHASMEIDGSAIFLVDDFPEFGQARSPNALGGSCVTIHRYVKDCDAAVKRAVDAGPRARR